MKSRSELLLRFLRGESIERLSAQRHMQRAAIEAKLREAIKRMMKANASLEQKETRQ